MKAIESKTDWIIRYLDVNGEEICCEKVHDMTCSQAQVSALEMEPEHCAEIKIEPTQIPETF